MASVTGGLCMNFLSPVVALRPPLRVEMAIFTLHVYPNWWPYPFVLKPNEYMVLYCDGLLYQSICDRCIPPISFIRCYFLKRTIIFRSYFE